MISVKLNSKHSNKISCAGLIVNPNAIIDSYNKRYKLLKTEPFGKSYQLVINASFYNLPSVSGAMGTCFLVNYQDEYYLITAKHVLDIAMRNTMSVSYQSMIKKIKVVFGFRDDYSNYAIKTENIIEIEAIHNNSTNTPYDFAILKPKNLPHALKVIAATIDFDFTPQSNVKIYTQGYPYGMPIYTSYGTICKKSQRKIDYYITNLSAFNGQSGSPVFIQSNKIIGILFGGGIDFVYKSKSSKLKSLKYNKFIEEKENGIFVLPIDYLKSTL